MTKFLLAMIVGVSVTGSALARVPSETTGGRSGGPNQSEAVVPSGATGGRSGGPNQSGFTKKPTPAKKKTNEKP